MRRLLVSLLVLAGALAGVPAPAGATMTEDTYHVVRKSRRAY